jgi:hypothetical protein
MYNQYRNFKGKPVKQVTINKIDCSPRPKGKEREDITKKEKKKKVGEHFIHFS